MSETAKGCPWCGTERDSDHYERWLCGSTDESGPHNPRWQHPECAAFCRGRASKNTELELLEMVQDLVAQSCTIDDQESGRPMLAASANSAYEDAIEYLCGRVLLAPVPGRKDRYEWVGKEVTP